MKKVFQIFLRDLKVNLREMLPAYMLFIPLLFAILINVFAPGINDTTVNIALVKDENVELEEYLADFAKVSVYADEEAIKERVARRDDIFGYIRNGDGYYILQQGNEAEHMVEFARGLLAFYNEDVQIEDSTAVIETFDRTVPPLKKMLVNIVIMFSTIMGGMMIAMNIIEEKADKTIRAIHLTPMSRQGFIVGKSLMGMFLPIYATIAIVLITGFRGINWLQMLLMILVSMIISLLAGFLMGLTSSTFMDAAGSVKMLFMPLMAGVLVAELTQPKWHWTVYWNPFYWSYQAVDGILSYTSTWGYTLMAAGIVFGISVVAYLIMMPHINKGLM